MKKITKNMLLRLGPDLIVLILFTFVWMILVSLYGAKIHFVEGSTVLPSLIAIMLLVYSFFSHAREILFQPGKQRISFFQRSGRILRDWLPLILIIGVYETLRDYTGIIRPDNIDDLLLKWDMRLFGVEPVIWIQQFIHPIATDFFALMYMLYFFLPMIVAALLYSKNRRQEFQELVLSCIFCLYTGYVLYLIFPAGPPRLFEGITFEPAQLTGYFGIFDFTQKQMDSSIHVLHHSSFPSLHCALSLLAVLHAWRYGNVWNKKWLIIINTFIAINIWIATIYLRHHWTVDIFAGGLVGIVAFVFAIFVKRLWNRLQN